MIIKLLIGRIIELLLLVWLLFVLVHGWALLLISAAAFVPLGRWLNARSAAQRGAERRRRAELIRRADEEHAMVLRGDAAGIYGQYPPPALIRGMGIWMGRRDQHVF